MNETEHTLGRGEHFSAEASESGEPMLHSDAPLRASGPMFIDEEQPEIEAEAEQDGLIRRPEQLTAAREARGLSLVEVANRLRFYPRQVQALEAGTWHDLPGIAFVRAALRSYARLLEVDVTPLLESVGGFAQPAEIRPTSSLSEPMPRSGGSLLFGASDDVRRWLPWGALALIALVALAFFYGGGAELTGMRALISTDTGLETETIRVPTQSGPAARAAAQPGVAASDGAEAGASAADGPAGAAGGAAEAVAGATPAAAGAVDAADAADAPGAGAGAQAQAAPAGAAAPEGEARVAQGETAPAQSAAGEGGSVRLRAAVSLGVSGAAGSASGAATGAPATAARTGSPATGSGAAGQGIESAGAAAPAAAASSGLRVTSVREAWVEVREEDGKVVFTGIVRPDAPAEVQGTPPFRMTIGRASSVEVTYRGIPVDLRPYTRDDVARLEVR